jgi:hypothetical protein
MYNVIEMGRREGEIMSRHQHLCKGWTWTKGLTQGLKDHQHEKCMIILQVGRCRSGCRRTGAGRGDRHRDSVGNWSGITKVSYFTRSIVPGTLGRSPRYLRYLCGVGSGCLAGDSGGFG